MKKWFPWKLEYANTKCPARKPSPHQLPRSVAAQWSDCGAADAQILLHIWHSPPLFLFKLLGVFFVGCSAGGGSAVHPRALSKQHPLSSFSLLCWFSLISTAIRTSAGRWWEVCVCACVCVQRSGRVFKNSQFIEKLKYLMGGRAGVEALFLLPAPPFVSLCSEIQMCHMCCELHRCLQDIQRNNRNFVMRLTFHGGDGNQYFAVLIFLSSLTPFVASTWEERNNTSRALFWWLFLSSTCCKAWTGDRILIPLPLTLLYKSHGIVPLVAFFSFCCESQESALLCTYSWKYSLLLQAYSTHSATMMWMDSIFISHAFKQGQKALALNLIEKMGTIVTSGISRSVCAGSGMYWPHFYWV